MSYLLCLKGNVPWLLVFLFWIKVNEIVVSLSNLTAIKEVVFDDNTLSMVTVPRFWSVSGIISIVHCFFEKDGTLNVLMSKMVNSSSFVTCWENEYREVVKSKLVNKEKALSVMIKITANGHSFAFGRAFGKRPAWNRSQCNLQKLKTYSVTHLCSVSRTCSW